MRLTRRSAWLAVPALVATVVLACEQPDRPARKAKEKPAPDRPLTRLIFQDHDARSLYWADVFVGGEGTLRLGKAAEVAGFPKLDGKKQRLAQMQESGGLVLVGARDEEGGAYGSGWVLVQSGVGYTDHGDHGHWSFKKRPEVWDRRLDAKQGNPAHVYTYGGKFYVANDKLNGYTQVNPAAYRRGKAGAVEKAAPRFLPGGGNHITLAVAGDRVGYSCWIDGEGPNKGRVDVTPVTGLGRAAPAYSFRLPSGVIHGATACAGKVFFAPADGLCWVEADLAVRRKPEEVKVGHIDLGKDGESPRRTGAFATHGHHVLCVAGKGPGTSLILIDARAKGPKAIGVPLGVKKGARAVTPTVVTPEGKPYALVFHDAVKGPGVKDALEVVALDPDDDGDWSDAKVVKTLEVGRSAVEGHYGHHALAVDADGRFAFFTNPGDGTISALSLRNWTVVATFAVGGKPTGLVARGGMETED